MFTIDKNIAVPKARGAYILGYSETFRNMEVGDSFECEFEEGRRQGIYSVAKRQGIKISVHRQGDKMRVWRVE